MKNSLPKKSSGYSLIELIITISIATVLTTFGFSAYRKAQDRQITRAVGETIETVLKKAQKDAISGNKDCTGASLGVEVVIQIGGDNIRSTAKCDGNEGVPKITTLNNTSFAANTTLLFRPINSGLDILIPSGQTSQDILFTVSSSGLTHHILIEKPGRILYQGEVIGP